MSSSITLQGGRKLVYAEYGDPQGRPIFFFHGIPGSRLFRPSDQLTAKTGTRLICIDRPGYGLSTFQPNRSILDWPADVLHLADHLGTQRFAVAGHSGGGPYALACAYALEGRVSATALISSAGPVETPHALAHMSGLNHSGYRFGRTTPWLVWRCLIWFLYRQSRSNPEMTINRNAATRPEADAELLKQDAVREVCLASVVEAFQAGTRGHAWDARLITRPWGFDLEQIHLPIHLWHGSSDRTTPIQMASYIAERIPNARFHVCEKEAHLLIFPHWQEILTVLGGAE